ncbi:hypothetical protein SRABI128_03997 [Microbacterium sp. Bi128]|nr:hypothetical protein SRABI128_03997 [Microbacterium sp. Bi128]
MGQPRNRLAGLRPPVPEQAQPRAGQQRHNIRALRRRVFIFAVSQKHEVAAVQPAQELTELLRSRNRAGGQQVQGVDGAGETGVDGWGVISDQLDVRQDTPHVGGELHNGP